jgi:hypothetical protein
MSQAQRHTANAMVGATSLCSLIAGVSIISPEIRTQLANTMATDAGTQVSAMASRVLDYGNLALRLARDYGGDNTPLVGFGIVAIFLAFMMFKA